MNYAVTQSHTLTLQSTTQKQLTHQQQKQPAHSLFIIVCTHGIA
jgi:hypothetical protein